MNHHESLKSVIKPLMGEHTEQNTLIRISDEKMKIAQGHLALLQKCVYTYVHVHAHALTDMNTQAPTHFNPEGGCSKQL
jgi:hypothetical protein